MNLTNFYTSTVSTTELWGLNLGFYFMMLAVLIIVVIENAVFWNMKKKVVTTDDFLFALKNDAELETIEKTRLDRVFSIYLLGIFFNAFFKAPFISPFKSIPIP